MEAHSQKNVSQSTKHRYSSCKEWIWCKTLAFMYAHIHSVHIDKHVYMHTQTQGERGGGREENVYSVKTCVLHNFRIVFTWLMGNKKMTDDHIGKLGSGGHKF